MNILMVCLGNICRSPLAHGILEHLIKKEDLNWEIDSAGTGNWHIGEGPDPRSTSIAKKYGVDISGQRCRQFSINDFDWYDRIYVMDKANLRDVLSLARNEEDRKKVKLLLEKETVPDPYYEDDLFDSVYQMIEKGCLTIIQQELKNK